MRYQYNLLEESCQNKNNLHYTWFFSLVHNIIYVLIVFTDPSVQNMQNHIIIIIFSDDRGQK